MPIMVTILAIAAVFKDALLPEIDMSVIEVFTLMEGIAVMAEYVTITVGCELPDGRVLGVESKN